MRLDHIAYRVKDRLTAVSFFCEAFGHKVQTEFDITLEDGSTAKCTALEPPEKLSQGVPFTQEVEVMRIVEVNNVPIDKPISATYHLAPEIFVSSGPPGSVIDRWVNDWGRGIGGVHHMAYQVEDVRATMKKWIEMGWLFTTNDALDCEDLTQVFSKPHPLTGIIYEFIERRGQHGFCRDNVAKLMSSTADLSK